MCYWQFLKKITPALARQVVRLEKEQQMLSEEQQDMRLTTSIVPSFSWNQVGMEQLAYLSQKSHHTPEYIFPNQSVIEFTVKNNQGRKGLEFDNRHQAFLCYKNLNVPSFYVRLLGNIPPFSQHTLFAKTILLKQRVDDHGLEIDYCGLEGEVQLPFHIQDHKNVQAEFRGLRFKKTSYAQKNCRYYLLVLLLQREENSQGEITEETVGLPMISSPIFVESRKKAFSERQKLNKNFIPPFHPKLLEGVNKPISHEGKEENPDVNKSALYQYIVDRRIKCKTFHPLYLYLYFNEAFHFYYNSSLLKNPKEDENFVYNFHQHLYETIYSDDDNQIIQPILMMQVKGQNLQYSQVKKIIDVLRHYYPQQCILIEKSEGSPSEEDHFAPLKLEDQELICKQYRESYRNIIYEYQKCRGEVRPECELDNYDKLRKIQLIENNQENADYITSSNGLRSIINISNIQPIQREKLIPVKVVSPAISTKGSIRERASSSNQSVATTFITSDDDLDEQNQQQQNDNTNNYISPKSYYEPISIHQVNNLFTPTYYSF